MGPVRTASLAPVAPRPPMADEVHDIAVTQITVPQGTLWHTSIQALFPLITKGEDFSLLIETGSRETYVYGSVIENSTNEAKFIEPMIAATVQSAAAAQ